MLKTTVFLILSFSFAGQGAAALVCDRFHVKAEKSSHCHGDISSPSRNNEKSHEESSEKKCPICQIGACFQNPNTLLPVVALPAPPESKNKTVIELNPLLITRLDLFSATSSRAPPNVHRSSSQDKNWQAYYGIFQI
jgi:hypothetical protein